jgi:hypothetical protein
VVRRIDNDNSGAVHWKPGAVAAPSRRKAPPDSRPRHVDSAGEAAHDDGRAMCLASCNVEKGRRCAVTFWRVLVRNLLTGLRPAKPHQAMAPSLASQSVPEHPRASQSIPEHPRASQTLSTGPLSPSTRLLHREHRRPASRLRHSPIGEGAAGPNRRVAATPTRVLHAVHDAAAAPLDRSGSAGKPQ